MLLDKAISKTENLKNTELNAVPVYEDRYIKNKTGAFSGKV